MKKKIKLLIKNLVKHLRIRNVILFESFPDFSDNTKAVFDEMLRRNFNEKYELVWVFYENDKLSYFNDKYKDVKNVKFISCEDNKFKVYYRNVAKLFVVCNMFLVKVKSKQGYCDLAHGCALKNASGKYSLPSFCADADVMTISNYLAPFDAHNLCCDISCMKPLGYARNDDLFRKIDVHQVFPNLDFEKVIYWLPTYRQHFWGVANHSDISMPIIYTQQDANLINECAVKNKMLIIVKVHQVQDVTKISEYNLSNLIFIKNDFFDDKDFTNYQLLGSSDAMISDYSSVYYDYLLCDKPIGLCFDDFEEYNKREGFTMDPNVILAGGEKIYNTNDFCDFIANVAQGKDLLKEKRNEIKLMCHDNIDNKSSERIVDYLEEKYLK